MKSEIVVFIVSFWTIYLLIDKGNTFNFYTNCKTST
jgi:hypothetical protein